MLRAAVVLLSLWLVGCTAHQNVQEVLPLTALLRHYPFISVNVTAANTVASDEDFPAIQAELTSSLQNKLAAVADFRSVTGGPSNALLLTVNITGLDVTTRAGRSFLGVAAGKAVLKAEIVLADVQSRVVLWRADFNATSGTRGVLGPDTDTGSQLDALVTLIVQHIAANRSQ